MIAQLNTLFLLASLVFSLLAVVISIFAAYRALKLRLFASRWRQLEESYSLAAKAFEAKLPQIEGDLDRCKDRLELHLKAFSRFRSRVTMADVREKERNEIEHDQNDVLHVERPWTEAEKAQLRLKLHHGGLFNATVPRDIKED